MTTPFTMDANAFLMGGGIPSAQFPNQAFGTTVSGPITTPPTVEQQKDLDSGEPKVWSDGKPMMQMVVTVQTSLRDPQIVDDDGQRKFYIKAKLLDAVRTAVRQSGARGLEVGGVLSITYVADGEVKKRGHNPPKIYTATYMPPSAVQASDFLQGAPQAPAPAPQYAAPAPAPAVPAQPAQPAPTPAAGAAWTPPPGLAPEQAAALAALDPQQRAALGFA
ncbi:hypothetical protein [Streptosporangium jomthongense]|uniref:Single-stranded DNA-binding protein n=1 Tax=Streptosporangium jomthongense TaxID=1193683 RepID=A0ABV8EXA2_9ACTN